MTEARAARKLPMPGIVAAVLVAAGVLLWMFVSRGLLIVAALGAFGPGLLRELGWLGDHDEFQQQAARRAGYHAYIAGGVAAMLVLSAAELLSGETFGESAEWIRFVLVVMWLTWLSSTLLTYWGARVTTARVLRVFGSFWAVFVIADLVGGFVTGSGGRLVMQLLGVGVGLLVVAPFFGLAWTARRWPRATGAVLMLFVVVFVLVFFLRRHTPLATTVLTFTLLIGPLITCGLALLFDWGGAGDDEAGS